MLAFIFLLHQDTPRPGWLFGAFLALLKRGDLEKITPRKDAGRKVIGFGVFMFLIILLTLYFLLKYGG